MILLIVPTFFAAVALMFGARLAIRHWMGGPKDGSDVAGQYAGVIDAPGLTEEERRKLRERAKERLLSQ